ncbi:MAG: ATP-binding cassette domain-containing protein [Erysipelothrix sp.]|nr:ATP-binding cassette domain-containing protein [Erysipelothrix sp.]
MLKVNNVTKYYKNTKGVENISFQIESGQAIGIIGINGSGKTTFFKVLLGLLNGDSGSISYLGKDIKTYDNKLLGYLPEERCLYKDLTVLDQVLFLGRLKKMEDHIIEEKLDEYLQILEIRKYRHHIIGKLSKGNQQKVQIICALIHDPKIIVLDEPLSGLDIINVNILKRLIHKLKTNNKIILLASHQFEHIEEFCERLLILKNGDTMFKGYIKELKAMSNLRYLRLDKLMAEKYLDQIDYTNIKMGQEFYELEIDNPDHANFVLHTLVTKERGILVSLMQPTIEKIVREFNLV